MKSVSTSKNHKKSIKNVMSIFFCGRERGVKYCCPRALLVVRTALVIITIYLIKHLLFFFLSTTNGSESFHRTYNAQFHSSHPSVHVVISILKETQEETCTKIQSVFKGRIKKMDNSDLNRIKEAMKEYNKYKIHKNIITYLSKICYISGTKV